MALHFYKIYDFKLHGTEPQVINSVRTIDIEGKRICLTRLHDGFFAMDVFPGDRIAQGMIIPIQQVSFEEGELSDTDRGAGGFGSTGK